MTEGDIASAARTPIGAFNGSLSSVPAHYLGEVAIREALRRAGVEPGEVSEVVLGQVLTAGTGQNPARQAAVNAGIPMTVPASPTSTLSGPAWKACARRDSVIPASATTKAASRPGDAREHRCRHRTQHHHRRRSRARDVPRQRRGPDLTDVPDPGGGSDALTGTPHYPAPMTETSSGLFSSPLAEELAEALATASHLGNEPLNVSLSSPWDVLWSSALGKVVVAMAGGLTPYAAVPGEPEFHNNLGIVLAALDRPADELRRRFAGEARQLIRESFLEGRPRLAARSSSRSSASAFERAYGVTGARGVSSSIVPARAMRATCCRWGLTFATGRKRRGFCSTIGTPAALMPIASREPPTIAPELTILFAATVRAVSDLGTVVVRNA